MSEDELIALLRLQCIPHIGSISAKKLITHCGSPEAVFKDNTKNLKKIPGIRDKMINELLLKKYHYQAVTELKYIQNNSVEYFSFLEENYPNNLKHCDDSPLLLFKRGNINLKEKKIISVVGTRGSTRHGADFCKKIIEELVEFNPIIVSGFAMGIDIGAQLAAVENGLQTIGCLAHGLNQVYPRSHQKYIGLILDNGGFLTEFWSSSLPERINFLKRNRIIAGLSAATIVVESGNKGGSLVTADIAHSYNRDIFAVPGRPTDQSSAGCNNLIKSQKAHMLTTGLDVAYILGWEPTANKTQGLQTELFLKLSPEEKEIYDYLFKRGRQSIDQIALDCKQPLSKTLTTLFQMELRGILRNIPGKLYEII